MSLRVRSIAAAGLIAVVFFWPFAHHVLAERVGFNPWKGFGWSMYCTPPPEVNLQIGETGPRGARLLPLGLAPPAVQAAVREYRRERELWGAWSSPDTLADTIRAWRPDVQTIVIRVRTLRFRAGEDRWRESTVDYRYPP